MHTVVVSFSTRIHFTGLARVTAIVCIPETYTFLDGTRRLGILTIASQDVTARMYSSTDLLNWENRGLQSTVGGMWRPKFAKPNGNFWVCYNLISLNTKKDHCSPL